MHADLPARFPSLSCNLGRVCQMPFAKKIDKPRVKRLSAHPANVRFWANSGHCWILTRVGSSAYDPKRTFGPRKYQTRYHATRLDHGPMALKRRLNQTGRSKP